MYTVNYLLALITDLLFHETSISMKPPLPQKIILNFQVLKQLLLEKVPLLTWLPKHGITF